MADKGTFIGEVQRGIAGFWHLRWRIKGPIMAVVVLLVIGIASSAGGSSSNNKVVATSGDSPTAVPSGTPKDTATPKPTNTPKATDTPKPTATPAPPTPTPEPAGFSFGSGKKLVGSDVQAVTYRTRSAPSNNCYWERLKGLGGTLGEVAANDNASGPAVVTISAADVAFNSTGCPRWTQDLSAITKSPTDPFGDGTYIVGVDISAGVWKSDGTGDCYWQRERDFSGNLSGIISNDNATGPTIVQIGASDKGFLSHGCGHWTKAP